MGRHNRCLCILAGSECLDGQIDSILSLDLGPRVSVVEAAITAPNTVRYATIGDLVAADVPVSADTVEVLGYAAAGDSGAHKRVRGNSGDPDAVQSADGAWWSLVEIDRARPQASGGVDDDSTDNLLALEIATSGAGSASVSRCQSSRMASISSVTFHRR